jgi:hypothetical protein
MPECEGANAWTCPWAGVRYQEANALRTALQQRFESASTVNRHLAVLRGVLGEALDRGLMKADAHAAARRVRSVKVERLPAGRALESGELGRCSQAALGTAAPLAAVTPPRWRCCTGPASGGPRLWPWMWGTTTRSPAR